MIQLYAVLNSLTVLGLNRFLKNQLPHRTSQYEYLYPGFAILSYIQFSMDTEEWILL
jgi:hypothetical protein